MSQGSGEHPKRVARVYVLPLILASVLALVSLCLLGPLLLRPVTEGLLPPDMTEDDSQKYLDSLSANQRVAMMAQQEQILVREPLSPTALGNAAALAALSNNKLLAGALAQAAAEASLRDVGAQLTAVNLALASRDYTQAVYRIDGVLRARPELQQELFRSLVAVIGIPEGVKAVAQSLAQQPPWRRDFVASLLEFDNSGQLAYVLLSALRKSGAPVLQEELQALVGRHIQQKAFDRAYFIWLDFLTDEQLRHVGNVFDGDFDLEPRNMYFDWTISPANNVRIAVTNRPGSQNRALMLDFFQFKGAFGNAYQYLRLQPGRYEVAYETMAINLDAEGGLVWRLSCIGTDTSSYVSRVLNSSGPWSKETFKATIPPQGCDTQILQLTMASTAVLDSLTSGQMYFDAFTISADVKE